MKRLKKGLNLIIIGIILLLCMPVHAFTNELPTITPNWASLNGGISLFGGVLQGSCNDIAVDAADNIYVGGSFTMAGEVAANNIAKWDGNSWAALGDGLPGECEALAVDAMGNIYASVSENVPGVPTMYYVTKWDGSTWTKLGSNFSGEPFNACLSLAVDHMGNVYAGGFFRKADDVTVNFIAKWDGSAWSALGNGLGFFCSSVAVDAAGNVYAGGSFREAAGAPGNRIAKWDGSSWSPLGGGLNGDCSTIHIDALGNVYAGGRFNMAGGVTASNIAKWDGSSWSALGGGLDASFFPSVIAISTDALGNVYAGGQFTTAGGVSANNIAVWDGGSWSALGGGLNSRCIALAGDGTGTVYAGGQFTKADCVDTRGIAAYGLNLCTIDIADVIKIDESCIGENDGKIIISASTCTSASSFQYSIDGGQTLSGSPKFSGLGAGTYEIYIQDAANPTCNTISTITLEAMGSLPCGFVDNGGIGCNTGTSTYNGGTSFSLSVVGCAPNTGDYTEDQTAFVTAGELCGDGAIVAQVTEMTNGGYAGVMMRASEDPSSAKVAIGTNLVNRVRREVRVSNGTAASVADEASQNRYWVRIIRTGSTFSTDVSTNGVTWVPNGVQNIQTGACIKAGLYTYVDRNTPALTATFDNVSVTGSTLALMAPNTAMLASTSSSTLALEQLSVFPNPTSGVLHVDLQHFAGHRARIRLLNNLGQQVLVHQVDEAIGVERLDASALRSGVYYVVVNVGEEVLTKRVVVE